MSIRGLSYEAIRVNARIANADRKHKKYINNFCEFEDPEWVDDLFVKMDSRSFDFGTIDSLDISKSKNKEFWTIHTTKGWFEFQVLDKPEWIEVPKKAKVLSDVEKLNNKRTLKDFFKRWMLE